MNIDKLAADLRDDEGWREHAYADSLGFLTIGYGFLIDPKKGGALPREVGDYWLAYLVERKWRELVERLPWVEKQPDDVQMALANMAYQMGVDGVLRFKLMLAALERGDRETAAENALDSTWHAQTPNRAERVADLIRGHA